MCDILHGIYTVLTTYCDEYFFPYKIEGSFPGPHREGSNVHKKKPSESEEVKIDIQMEWNHPQVTQMAAGSWHQSSRSSQRTAGRLFQRSTSLQQKQK